MYIWSYSLQYWADDINDYESGKGIVLASTLPEVIDKLEQVYGVNMIETFTDLSFLDEACGEGVLELEELEKYIKSIRINSEDEKDE